jgi:DMSO/TMAO reductase YedYZ molybdopterin-dependent catalytic subunit
MGCARWKGARLKDVLDLVGLKGAVEVVFDGADGPVLDKTPDLVKSLPVWKAIEETTLVAYEMNGEPLHGACHSLDYIVMNSPFLDAAHWDAEVAK